MPPQIETVESTSTAPPDAFYPTSIKGVHARDFEWSYTDEPHRSRREMILKAHPEVGIKYVKKFTYTSIVCVHMQVVIKVEQI